MFRNFYSNVADKPSLLSSLPFPKVLEWYFLLQNISEWLCIIVEKSWGKLI